MCNLLVRRRMVESTREKDTHWPGFNFKNQSIFWLNSNTNRSCLGGNPPGLNQHISDWSKTTQDVSSDWCQTSIKLWHPDSVSLFACSGTLWCWNLDIFISEISVAQVQHNRRTKKLHFSLSLGELFVTIQQCFFYFFLFLRVTRGRRSRPTGFKKRQGALAEEEPFPAGVVFLYLSACSQTLLRTLLTFQHLLMHKLWAVKHHGNDAKADFSHILRDDKLYFCCCCYVDRSWAQMFNFCVLFSHFASINGHQRPFEGGFVAVSLFVSGLSRLKSFCSPLPANCGR